MKRAKIATVKRGSTLTEAPVRLPAGHTIPIRSNSELAKKFEQEEIAQLNEVYRRR
jgi:hypothetical protein